MAKKKILRLMITRELFDKIVEGKEKTVIRDLKPYWTKRLLENGEPIIFDEIHFCNGYSQNSPFVSATHRDTAIDTRHGYIELYVGRLLRVENYIVKTRKAVAQNATSNFAADKSLQ